MILIMHRVNSAELLKQTPKKYGVEIDVRHDNKTGKLYLNHDPGIGEDLDEYLSHYNHSFIVFNIKEAGIEQMVIDLAKKHGVTDYFLLDVEFPYLYRATRKENIRDIAVRYSEAEPIEMSLAQSGFVDWVWVDTNTKLPLTKSAYVQLKDAGFKLCLVSPDRWGRPDDIEEYKKQLEEDGIEFDAVMVGAELVEKWE